jgi:hypothetical protein
MKNIVALTVLGSMTAAMAGFSEHACLYKDPRIMGMGGVNVAVGGYSTSVFHNPAGLNALKPSRGFEVELLGIGVGMTADVESFVDDLDEAADAADETAAIADVLEKYSGEHFHFDVTNYTSLSRKFDDWSFSVGILNGADANFIPHGNGGTDGLLETRSRVYNGLILGGAKAIPLGSAGTVDVGLGFKYISQVSYEAGLSVSEITDNNDDLGEYLQDTYEQSGSAMGLDLGMRYALAQLEPFSGMADWKPVVGMSILNIGGPDIDDAYGSQPMTVNLGFMVAPDVAFVEHLKLGVDYVDLFNANRARVYTPGGDYKEFDDGDFMKRLRLGASLGLVDNSWATVNLDTGLYQGHYTAGLEAHLTIVKLNLATYEEEIGIESGQISDRRYMGQFSIAW